MQCVASYIRGNGRMCGILPHGVGVECVASYIRGRGGVNII